MNALVAVCDTDIDDQNEINDFDSVYSLSQTNNDITSPAEGHFEVTCNSQQHDNDVALVPAEQLLGVQRNRPLQQTDSDIVLLPAEGHLEVHDDRQQQQQLDSVYGNQHAEGHLHVHVLSNRQVTTIKHPVERHSRCSIVTIHHKYLQVFKKLPN